MNSSQSVILAISIASVLLPLRSHAQESAATLPVEDMLAACRQYEDHGKQPAKQECCASCLQVLDSAAVRAERFHKRRTDIRRYSPAAGGAAIALVLIGLASWFSRKRWKFGYLLLPLVAAGGALVAPLTLEPELEARVWPDLARADQELSLLGRTGFMNPDDRHTTVKCHEVIAELTDRTNPGDTCSAALQQYAGFLGRDLTPLEDALSQPERTQAWKERAAELKVLATEFKTFEWDHDAPTSPARAYDTNPLLTQARTSQLSGFVDHQWMWALVGPGVTLLLGWLWGSGATWLRRRRVLNDLSKAEVPK